MLTLIHKTASVLPRALPPHKLKPFADILLNALQDLSSAAPRPARLAVYAVDQWSPAQDIVTALLQDPLTSDQSQNDRIRTRWETIQRPLNISHETVTSVSSVLKVSSPYLLQFPVPLQITEIPPSTSQGDRIEAILQADTTVIVCNPLTTCLHDLLKTGLLSDNPNIILVLTCTSDSPPVDPPSALLSRFVSQGQLSDSHFDGLSILPMDPPRAVAAIDTLRADSRSPTAVREYQDNFIGSRVSTLTTALKSRFAPGLDHIRTQTALAQIKFALATCNGALHNTRRELETINAAVRDLNDRIEEAKIRVQTDILGPAKELGGDELIAALDNAAKDLRIVMDRLSWFKVLSSVDEISHIVGQAVDKAWCRELEKKLIFHTGRLSTLQHTFTKDIFTLLHSQHTAPFNSAVLSNALHQVTASPSYALTPHILTSPIHTRRTQIIMYPTTQLHVAGQRAVLSMSSSIIAGASVGWAGWVGWLAGTGEGLLGFIGMDAGTAMGVGMLSAVAGVRWAISRWDKAKRRWWEDWERIAEGLGRDLRATLDRVVRENVVVVAETGCERLSELVAKRREECERVEGELEDLQTDLKTLEHQNSN